MIYAEPKRARIGLCMIVKNEAAVIERCLRSVMPIIDTWLIVDTGSTDGTCEVITKTMAAVPGSLHRRPWKDFAHNRTEAIELARANCDYLFFIDADEMLLIPEAFQMPALVGDAYSATIIFNSLRYARTCLVSTARTWRYRGVLHEYLECERPVNAEPLNGFNVRVTTQGARSRNPKKYYDDAIVLQAALLDEPGNLRYMFYLAQSWRDAGESAKALKAYRTRAALTGWDEEDWYSKYQVARLMDITEQPEADTINCYLKAHEARPSRAEPLMWLGIYLHRRGRWANAKAMFTLAVKIPFSGDKLFIENDCYVWRRYDELALSFYYQDAKDQAKKIWEVLLRTGRIPKQEVDRVVSNISLCTQ